MTNNFASHQQSLKKLLHSDSKNVNFNKFKYFIKGDISGIQEFIFNVKSEKAAKSLKARSFYIEALSKICIYQLGQHLNDLQEFYDGGGNFYLFTNENPQNAVDELRAIINTDCKTEAYYVVLSYVDSTTLKDGENLWEVINRQSNFDKLKKFAHSSEAFSAYPATRDTDDWAQFTTRLNNSSGFESIKPDEGKTIKGDRINIFNSSLKLSKENSMFEESILNKTPVWRDELWQEKGLKQLLEKENIYREEENEQKIKKGSTIDFHFLAKFAHLRTGTEKLGILKLDVDNLGNLFRGISDLNEIKKLSIALEWFFDSFLLQLWKTSFEDKTEQVHFFSDNIYVVFSGGDDCFLVGAWDAVFEFSYLLQRNFEAFARFLKSEIPVIKDKQLTISAGLMALDAKFPVVRFAQMAEDCLHAAKHQKEKTGKKSKNKINVFSQNLKWAEFEKARELEMVLYDLVVTKGESRALLDRVKRSASGYSKNLEHARKGKIIAPKVWKLFYFLRNVKKTENRQILEEKVIRPYSLSLIHAFNKSMSKESGKKYEAIHPGTFPVAARWTELMTKKKNNQ